MNRSRIYQLLATVSIMTYSSLVQALAPTENGYLTSVLTQEEGRALGQAIAGSGRIDIHMNQLATSGVISRGGTDFRVSRPLANVLREFIRRGKGFSTLSGPRKDQGFHGFESKYTTLATTDYIVSALDIGQWEGQTLDILHPDQMANAIVDIIDSFPPGAYDLGIPRRPYNPERAEAKAEFDMYGSGALASLYNASTQRFNANPDAYYEFYPADNNSSAPVNSQGQVVTNVDEQLKLIRNSNYRLRIQTAVAAARKRGVIIVKTYPDALNHLHITVRNLKIARPYDFNNDAQPDIIWRALPYGVTHTGQPHFWEMQHDARVDGFWSNLQHEFGGTCAEVSTSDPNWKLIGAADFDKDAENDLLWYNSASGMRSIWYMDGPTLRFCELVPGTSALDPNWKLAGLGDFNADGKPELFWINTTTFQTGIWDIYGNSISNNPYTWNFPDNSWTVAAVGDVDGDGDADVLWRKDRGEFLSLWLNQGGQFYDYKEPALSGPYGAEWEPKVLADYSGDGSADLLWQN